MLTRATGLTRRLLTIGAAATLTLTIGLTGSAAARGPGADCPPGQTDCNVWDDIPGNPGNPGNPGGGGGGNNGPARKCNRNGEPVPCYDGVLGWFSSSNGCYYKLAEPQPDGVPEGQDAYLMSCAGTGEASQVMVMLDAPPAGFGAPPDPAEIAAQLMADLTLLPPRIGIAPHPRTGPGLVGLPVWLWTNSGPETWGPQEDATSQQGIRVWIRAEVEKIVWKMGNGDEVTCPDRGQAYNPDTDKDKEPPCGYDGYPKPSGSEPYKVSAETFWVVEWGTGPNGNNEGDPMTTSRQSAVNIEIDELQVVTR
jgi:hypothetical protein